MGAVDDALRQRQELAYLIRRIEYDVDVDANVERLWRHCANHRVGADDLVQFIRDVTFTPNKVLKALSKEKQGTPDSRRIAVISCINDERKYEECLLYLNQCVLPKGMQMEFIPIYRAKSMASGYQEAMLSNHAKYKIYIHQDLCIVEKNALQIMLNIFKRNPDVGMIGLAGCVKLPSNGVWFDAGGTGYGVTVQAVNPGHIVCFGYSKMKREFESVAMVDGIFMMTQYDLPWREDLFHGWHFYDVSQSMEFRRKGYQVAVPKGDIWCIHDSPIKQNSEEYEHWRKVFIENYGNEL